MQIVGLFGGQCYYYVCVEVDSIFWLQDNFHSWRFVGFLKDETLVFSLCLDLVKHSPRLIKYSIFILVFGGYLWLVAEWSIINIYCTLCVKQLFFCLDDSLKCTFISFVCCLLARLVEIDKCMYLLCLCLSNMVSEICYSLCWTIKMFGVFVYVMPMQKDRAVVPLAWCMMEWELYFKDKVKSHAIWLFCTLLRFSF